MAKLTVGVPVYNGAPYIKDALEDLAAQTHPDFDVIISDNASTDETTAICAAFCDEHPRFRHVIQPSTTTVYENFRYLRDIADCDYFAYRAFDDLSSPDYLEKLAQVLDEASSARLAVGRVRTEFGGAQPDVDRPYPANSVVGEGRLAERIIDLMFSGHPSWMYGIWRHAALTETFERVVSEYEDLWAGDQLMLLHVILRDGIRGRSDAPLFVQRILETERDYAPKARPRYVMLRDRNERFESTARNLLAECPLDSETRAAISSALPEFTFLRCYPAKRLRKARIRHWFGLQ